MVNQTKSWHLSYQRRQTTRTPQLLQHAPACYFWPLYRTYRGHRAKFTEPNSRYSRYRTTNCYTLLIINLHLLACSLHSPVTPISSTRNKETCLLCDVQHIISESSLYKLSKSNRQDSFCVLSRQNMLCLSDISRSLRQWWTGCVPLCHKGTVYHNTKAPCVLPEGIPNIEFGWQHGFLVLAFFFAHTMCRLHTCTVCAVIVPVKQFLLTKLLLIHHMRKF